MIKKVLLGILVCVFSVNGVKYHQDSRGAEIHTPFRWIVADSSARLALSVAAADTQKFCFQLADTSIWLLIDNSPKVWRWISGKKVNWGISVYNDTNFLKLAYGVGDLPGSPSSSLPVLISNYQRIYLSTYNNTRQYYTGFIGYQNGATIFALRDTTGTGTPFIFLSTLGGSYIKKDLTVDSLKLGSGGSWLKTHITGTMPCTVKTTDFTVQTIATAYWTKTGNVMTVSFPKMLGTSNSITLGIYCTFPYKPKLTDGVTNSDTKLIQITNAGTSTYGMVYTSDYLGQVTISKEFNVSGFTNLGQKGIPYPFSMTFITEN